MSETKALTVKETAAHLRITNQAVYNLIKRDELPAFKVGSAIRILEADLDGYINKQKRLFAEQNKMYLPPAEGVFAARRLSAHFETGSSFFKISDVSFDIPLGGTLGILGLSGSGKTLLLKAIAGLVPLDAGAIFNGLQRIDQIATTERRIGLVFQDYALYPIMNGRENIGFPLKIARTKKSVIDPAVCQIAKELGIAEDYLSKKINILPEGIKQLIAIGRAENRPNDRPPELFLMDEPLIHLDARLHEEVRVFLKSLVAHYKTTTIYTFNDAADALALADQLLIIRNGVAIQIGPTANVFENPVDKMTMELLSINGVNAVPGMIESGNFTSTYLWSPLASQPVFQTDIDYAGPAEFCFRPENVKLQKTIAKKGSYFHAVIERCTPYDGERNLATVQLLPKGKDPSVAEPLKINVIIPQSAEGNIVFSPNAAVVFPNLVP